MGVNAEVFLYDEEMPTDPKTLMLAIISGTSKKKWGYYHDMTRQLWDEARHAMMGEAGFAAAGKERGGEEDS